MRPRTSLLAGLAVLAALGLAVGALGYRDQGDLGLDRRASTFLTGPLGSRGLLEAARATGLAVRRFRGRAILLPAVPDSQRTLLAFLDPATSPSVPERTGILAWAHRGDLLLAGKGADPLMRCFGYQVDALPFDSVATTAPGGTGWRSSAVLKPTRRAVQTDTTRLADFASVRCTVPRFTTVQTLLGSPRGPVALRLVQPDGRAVLLFADATPFRNRWLRDTDAGPFVLGLLAGHYDVVVFDERHQGFGASGSLGAATLAWSRASPWGWAAWQLALVGVVALLFGAVRFGPVAPGPSRQRRSSLEHVQALAAALGAARGHDEAIGAMVRGLRRRLSPATLRAREDWRDWLARLDGRSVSPDARRAIATLQRFTPPGQPAASVREAANAVEDVWENLRR